MSNLQTVNESTFQEWVMNAGRPVLVDFYADWCGPCNAMVPVLESFAADIAIDVIKVNVDEAPQLARAYGVRGIPTLTVFKDGVPIKTHVGSASRAELLALVGQPQTQIV